MMIRPQTLTNFFRALADPTRLRILHVLHCDEFTVGELVRIFDMPQSSVSRHLKFLREAGLVTHRAAGSATFYRAYLVGDPDAPDSALRRDLQALLAPEKLAPALRSAVEKTVALRSTGSESFFERIGAHWDALREDCFGGTFHLEALIHLLPSTWTVADLGTGTGYLLPLLARHFSRVIAVDSSHGMLELAGKRVDEAGVSNVELRLGDLCQLPISEGEVDLALLVLILHHLEDLRPAMLELGRIVAPSGQVLVVEYLPYENERFLRRMADQRAGVAPEIVRALLSEAGFNEFAQFALPTSPQPDHELAPLPQLYGMVARKKKVYPTFAGWVEKEP
jgi:ArsR family transcriptional regulator